MEDITNRGSLGEGKGKPQHYFCNFPQIKLFKNKTIHNFIYNKIMSKVEILKIQ